MAIRGMFHISLAHKCQLLFGLAVLLIIAAALFVPGYYMETFVHELQVRRARQLALLARSRLDPADPNWRQQQESLDRWWEVNARTELQLPPEAKPRLIKLPPMPTAGQVPPATPTLEEFWQAIQAWLREPLELCERWIDIPAPGGPIRTLIEAIPPEWERKVATFARRLAARLARSLATEPEWGRPLDAFLTECVREMRDHDTVNEKTGPREYSDNGATYRYVLAVRGPPTPSGSHPLVGLIDVKLPAPEIGRMVFFTRALLVLAGMLAGFLAVLVFYLISQRLILAPVRQLKALAERIAGGDLTARSEMKTGDEFEELSDSFNDMLVRLERARAELENANRRLDDKLGELAETNVALFEANRVKTEFLANVSHELRTPLTSIIGFADLLRDAAHGRQSFDHSRIAHYADNILTSGRGLLDMINDLLDLAKMEAHRIELHRTLFSPRDVCEALADFVKPTIDKQSLTLVLDLDDELPVMNSDSGKLRQILFNLLSNAIKYTPKGGTIRLTAQPTHDRAKVRAVVSDTGPGIAPDDQERIFEKFRQLDSSVTREHGGSGLGLAISKELCTMLGGTIRVESELGQGARFIVELPVECPELADRPLPSIM
jgi:signal transduction histidine kinase